MITYSWLIAFGIAVIVTSSQSLGMIMQSCTKNSQCGENQCCALRLRLFGYKGYCLRMKTLGEVCSPSVKAGKHFTCGCRVGLTCAITDVDKFKNPKYRCVRIPTETPEITEKPKAAVSDDSQDSPYVLMFSRYLKNRLNRLRKGNKQPQS